MRYVSHMTYEEIFVARYGRMYLGLDITDRAYAVAGISISRLSDEEWNDWQNYKTMRLDAIRRKTGEPGYAEFCRIAKSWGFD